MIPRWLVWPVVASVLGFALGGSFVWGVLYVPPEQYAAYNQQADNTAAQKKHKNGFWEKAADDPVAYFTLWLVGFTGVLAVSTVGLWIATLALYRAGERQLSHAQSEAETANSHRTAQFEQIAEQIEALRDSASATRALVREAENTAVRQLRAYVLPKNGRLDRTGSILRAHITLENGGQTPAYDIVYQGRVFIVPPEDPQELGSFTTVKFVLGPKAVSPVYIFSKMPYTAADESEYRSGRLKVIVKGTIKYRDAFDKSQTTEFGFEAFGDIWASRGHLRPIEGDYNIT